MCFFQKICINTWNGGLARQSPDASRLPVNGVEEALEDFLQANQVESSDGGAKIFLVYSTFTPLWINIKQV